MVDPVLRMRQEGRFLVIFITCMLVIYSLLKSSDSVERELELEINEVVTAPKNTRVLEQASVVFEQPLVEASKNNGLVESASPVFELPPAEIANNSTNNSLSAPVLDPSKKILYFAITHHSTINARLDACLRTWCARVLAHTGRKVIWYSNRNDSRVDHVVSVDNEDLYKDITWRMLAVWRHVYQTYPDYLWYARFWDDNIVFPETLELLIEGRDPDELLEIGRLANIITGGLIPPGVDDTITQADRVYLDGGGGSLMSRAAVRLFVSNMTECENWMREQLVHEVLCAYSCEDVVLSACKHRLFDIKFKRGLGLYHTAPPALGLADYQLHRDVQADPENQGFQSVTRSLHYASPEVMERVDRIWYGGL